MSQQTHVSTHIAKEKHWLLYTLKSDLQFIPNYFQVMFLSVLYFCKGMRDGNGWRQRIATDYVLVKVPFHVNVKKEFKTKMSTFEQL